MDMFRFGKNFQSLHKKRMIGVQRELKKQRKIGEHLKFLILENIKENILFMMERMKGMNLR